ncbi:DUF502 domain-containing protein [Hymenobacter sp. J193]|uniref:DUF502 domain-containing protein n=1 Tax=Hymenobacter sp. J193 TaxID=2898429 RepID=UPI0021518473|nr:DUF502 domain-containing protein [Hymenobacter sp. J193]MCR5887215.1 DUF502 domain-containing protein [Hymenobacter sp. J193]
MGKLIKYFLNGLLLVAPIVLTVYILVALFFWIDGLMNIDSEKYPGLGLLTMFVLVTVVGFIARSLAVRPLLVLAERILHRTPLVSIIYSSLKDLFDAFVGDNQKFNRPVLVCVNEETKAYRLGFATCDDIAGLHRPELMAVYYPHSYNFSGELQLVPKESVTYLELPSSEVMKFIVSGGVSKL